MMKKAECCECGKVIEIPDDIDPEQTAIFCSQRCIEAESRAIYVQEQRGQEEDE
jgi:endogenous inhibitor of DNA gyrase (YacG/DUF329 family)